ncbi:hypothetical protein NM688_g2435 [Phlebia brevispora]|uniref:Uncharacterized protein n=1 Tax=Phlebia brevispora TaxID=194682 RepID=A0ACC1T8U4_9APHY|nr:hypothetical protein NM688_g2435 [Phlebia brevispora]
MALSNRFPLRNRTGPQRTKVDENAIGRHSRQASVTLNGATRASHSFANINALKNVPQRHALGEVTTTAVNRKDIANGKLTGKVEAGVKHSRSSSQLSANGAQRVPLGPGRTHPNITTEAPVAPRVPLAQIQKPLNSKPLQRIPVPTDTILVDEEGRSDRMDVEMETCSETEMHVEPIEVDEPPQITNSQEVVESMVEVQPDDVDDEVDEEERLVRQWPDMATARAERYRKEVNNVRERFHEEPEDDENMCPEYADEIFQYMTELEDDCMPTWNYMDGQTDINWEMRSALVDWLCQVHLRYHLLPETLWIAINIVDRFLTRRVVSQVKLQLVGVCAMFIASKYEEILAPSVDEFVFLTQNVYRKEEILKGERMILQSLEFKISHYCSPYSWMRRISKADDYNIQTRTLSKFLTEVTLYDRHFLRVKPSMVAAIGMYTAQKMLGGNWDESFVYYSGYTEEHLKPGHALLVRKLAEQDFDQLCVYKKYAHKKFLKVAQYAQMWAETNYTAEANMDDMVLEE